MAATGWSGLNPILQYAGDPALSALRVTYGDGSPTALGVTRYTGGFLASAKKASGIDAVLDARANAGGYSIGFVTFRNSGNSATAAIWGSRDSTAWFLITATAMPSGAATSTAQWSGFWPFIAGGATWVSASVSGTGTVYITMDLG